MKRVAIFTGAGASAAFGYPVTNRILEITRTALANGELFEDYERPGRAAAELRKYLKALLPGFSNREATLPNVTDVISLVDHAIAASSTLLRGKPLSDHIRFRFLLEWATVDALIDPEETPKLKAQQKLLRAFSDHISGLCKAGKHELGLITTNYDTAIDRQLFRRLAPGAWYRNVPRVAETFDFGTSWRGPYTDRIYPRPTKAPMHIYKLHGSINWLRCDLCENIYVNPNGNIVHWAFYPANHDHNECYCRTGTRLRSAIVTPSFVRAGYDLTLQSIWKAALDFLRRANRWIIIGYGLPSEDVAIRALLIKAIQSREKLPAIDVIQLGDEAKPRYKLLFPQCEYHNGGLEAFPLERIR